MEKGTSSSSCIIRCLVNYGECQEQNGIEANNANNEEHTTKTIRWFSRLNITANEISDGLHVIDMSKKEIVYDEPIFIDASEFS